MKYLTPEQIASECDHLEGIANIKAINALYRKQDESHLWPIMGRFNVTKSAIRKARQFQLNSDVVYGLEYACLLDTIISEIVNHAY